MTSVTNNIDRARIKLLSQRKDPCEVGIWHVKGEDPNCDFGGTYIQPTLRFAEGEYKHVVEYALELPRFFIWGNGGSIEKIEVITVDNMSVEKRKKLLQRKRELENELESISKML